MVQAKLDKQALQTLFETRVRPAWEKGINAINQRNPRERAMIVVLAAALVLFLDYWVLIRPIVDVFVHTMPRFIAVEGELRELKNDQKNRSKIETEWAETQDRLQLQEKRFLSQSELPVLLESLSKLALDSDVKILSLRPAEVSSKQITSTRYIYTPIGLSGTASTHALGKFLARLENHEIYFRVSNLKIVASPGDIRRHSAEVILETYRKV